MFYGNAWHNCPSESYGLKKKKETSYNGKQFKQEMLAFVD